MKNEILNSIAQIIYDKKGFNTLILDVKDIFSLSDFLIIAEGNVDKHVRAIALEIIEELKKEEIRPHFVEGLERGDWIVIDYLDVMIHLFMPGLRNKYQLEELWNKGKIVEVDINTESNILGEV